MCINFQIDLSKFLTDTWTALSQPIGYLRDPKPRITLLTDAMDHLRSQSEDLKNKIRSADLDGKTPTNEVQYWLIKVADIDAKVLKIQTDHQNGSFRWHINRRAKHRLDEITTLSKNFVFDAVATPQLPQIGVQEVPAEPPTATDTMKPYLDKLHACLRDDGSRIIGIWGMGGVGKTTLLQCLNNGLCASEAGRNTPMFGHVIWAVASKDYKLGKLQGDIAKRLGLPSPSGEGEILKQAIFDFLKNKSFVLLLDDLWQQVNLADVGIPQLHRGGATKQKLVFTTRDEGVCGQMQARPKIKVECLKEEEAWLLFQEKVGEETLQADPRILQLARQVAKECDGLPLALVVIGSTMSTKKTPHEWQNAITHLQKSRPYDIYGMDDKIFHKLKFSYDNLPDEITRKCFLLCSLWPEDHSILKTALIECWMGHGLVDEGKFDNINEAYDSGYDLIGGLQAACLLERGDGYLDRQVKMHDVIRDLALWIASDCGEKPNKFIVHYGGVIASQDLEREVERISLIRSDLSDTSGLPANCSKLETLIVKNSNSFKSIVTGFFEGTPALTYLDLSYNPEIDDLTKEIGLLVNLRYLNLSGTGIESLPMELGYLCELRFLILRNLRIIDITCGVLEKLVMLSVIDMTHTPCPNLQELSRLRGRLKCVGICLESIEDLNQLAQMPNVLIWRLELARVRFINEPLHLLSPLQYLGSRSIQSSIQMLNIKDCENLEKLSMESDGDGDDIQKWCLSRLERLGLSAVPELKEIVWRGVSPAEMLPSLTVFTIFACHKLSNISWVIRLSSLEDLIVSFCDEMEQIIYDDNEIGEVREEDNGVGTAGCPFPSLKSLILAGLKSLRVFGGRPLMFPSLEVFWVNNCPKMKTLPFGAEMAGRKLKEIRGSAEWWEELEMEDNVRAALLPFFVEINEEALWTFSCDILYSP